MTSRELSLATGAASAAEVNIDVDVTFLLQFLLFATFMLVLKPLLFDPLLRVFEERERRTEGAKLRAKELDERAGELLRRYEAELERVRRIAGEERDRLRAETARLEAEILEEARAETARTVAAGKATIADEVRRVRMDLARDRPALAAEIASQVLGREVR